MKALKPSTEFMRCIEGYQGPFNPSNQHFIGVLIGEGIGSEVVPAALSLLEILTEHTQRRFVIQYGGLIGNAAKEKYGSSLTPGVIKFTKSIFDQKGALFCGPGGDRFVYELRKQFKLFCKFTPIEPLSELSDSGSVRTDVMSAANIVMVRENLGGIYQGQCSQETDICGEVIVSHHFSYTKKMVMDILNVAFLLAKERQNMLHVILKPGGIPAISSLWWECANEMSSNYPKVKLFLQEIDNSVYQLIADPSQFDVIVSPNLFGDVLADCGSLLLTSRGLSYSGNFDSLGNGVYQTGHGAAKDIAGKNIANPMGQIFSLGMMLRESFDWYIADEMLRKAVRETLSSGIFTADIAPKGCKSYGTEEFTKCVGVILRKQLNGLML